MEEEKERRHCCRFCKKRFPCGRSLGGHMRSHITALSSAEADEKLKRKQNCMGGLETGGYGLRENPKKTWRLSDLSSTAVHPQKGKVCRECGKRFRSRKALFGHMRCHPEGNPSHSHVEEGSRAGQDAFDSLSDNDSDTAVAMRRMRRSKRVAARYGASPSFTNASSSLSEVEQDTEEVAMCLMMLSRDVGTWGSLNSSAESSDNNSASLGLNKRSAEKGNLGFACDEDELMKKPRVKAIGDLGDFDACEMEDHTFDRRPEFGASESGFSGSGAKKVISCVYGDRFVKDHEFDGSDSEFADCEVGLEGSNIELRADSSKKKGKDCSNGCVGEVMEDSPKEFGKYTPISRARFDTHSVELDGDNFQNTRYDTMDFEVIKNRFKGGRYECTACNKTFQSYQALGGHRASHKKVKGCSASRFESGQSRFEAGPGLTDDNKHKPCRTDSLIDGEISHRMKKTKRHECSICFKVFASGQALGGHRRSHLSGNTESRATASQTIIIQHELQKNPSPNSLDLNLPAPIEEAANENVGFRSWWVEGNRKHEPLVGLISN